MAKVMVTGGAGFLGSHLCEMLLQLNHTVVAVDNLQTGRRENLAHLQDHPNFTLVVHDIIEPFSAANLAVDFDGIYNLACAASPPHYQRDPLHTTKTCVLGMLNVLDWARRCRSKTQHQDAANAASTADKAAKRGSNGARVLQASTSEIYGDPIEHPQGETYLGNVNCTGPRACYDEGKRTAETLCYDAWRTWGADVRVARIFNTYGPRMAPDDGRVITNFIQQALRGEALTVYGDGQQTRSFCYVDDLIAGLLRLMAYEPPLHHHDGSSDGGGQKPRKLSPVGPVNLGNPTEQTVGATAEQIRDLVGNPQATLSYHPRPIDDPRQRRPSIERAKQLLNWAPRIELEEGLRRTIAAAIGDARAA